MTRASVLIPIHDKPTTLPLTVDTVLRQSVQDLEVLLIGDGVTDQVRDVVAGLVASDPRVRFLDFPKGPHHGERYRHDAILAAESDAIFYLCDDDLLLPDHVADLLDLLETHDLVQCLNGFVRADGQVWLYAADLADPDCVAMHLREDVRFNAVSITGTAHTRAAYLRISRWDTTPSGQWPDHWQFRKVMGLPDFRGATSGRMTALQFPTSADGRDAWDDAARAAEVVPWHDLVVSPGAQAEIDRRVREGMVAQLVSEQQRLALLMRDTARLSELGTARGARIEQLQDQVRQQAATIQQQRARVQRLRARVQRLRARVHRLRARARIHAGSEAPHR
jgi:hypothetical protein